MDIKRRVVKKKEIACRPNIIPILDAVFIFIFFLLMSAEFIKFYVINSDAPAVKMVDSVGNDQKTPLNLALEISRNRIVVKTNPEGRVTKIVNKASDGYDWDELLKIMIDLKKNYMDENSIILRPQDDIRYKDIVKVIDIVREVPASSEIIGKNERGETVKTNKLFHRVIFEGEV